MTDLTTRERRTLARSPKTGGHVKASRSGQVADFIAECDRLGYTFTARGTIVAVATRFTPGDREAFVACETDGPGLLSLVPARGGSIWGTEGVGGQMALERGEYVQKISGVPNWFIKAASAAR